MLNPKNKNEELQQQDHEILEAIYERKQTLREYAIARSLTYEEAEDRLADALRRKKTALTYVLARSVIADGTQHIARQGVSKVLRSRATTQALLLEMFLDFDDLDAWMEIDQ